MSLVATWCYCNDGAWYEEPVWKGYDPDGSTRWFLCLDDDDPPEMVLRVDDQPENVPEGERAKLFPRLPWLRYTSNASGFKGQSRQFGGKFKRASTRWAEFADVPPPPQKYDTCSVTRPDYMGCYYDFARQNR